MWSNIREEQKLKDCKWGLWEFESDEVEVIGNVFDNPELLGGTK